jgi:putative phosphoesterase
MLIGIMSDSHDHLEAIGLAVDFFNQNNVDLVIHAGDLISPFTAFEFKRLKMPFEAIYGNNDGEREGLKTAFQELCNLEDFKEIDADGRKIGVIHGTNQKLVDALAGGGYYDVLIRGHNHQLDVYSDKTMIINPGETCGYLSGKRSVILLSTEDLNFEKVLL